MNERTIIGLMSGSSLDGLDIICVRFWGPIEKLQWEVLGKPITAELPQYLFSLLKVVHDLDQESIAQLHLDLGVFYGTAVKEYITANGISPYCVASHGHTIDHNPAEGYSRQIGDGHMMANESGLPCITDFRAEDILHGGQGAPLAPVVEHYLFGEYKMFLNLGGIANISLHSEDEILAFDVCPANQLLNHLANKMNLAFDDKGALARNGDVDEDLLAALHQDPFHAMDYPKSLDNNYVRTQYIEKLDTTVLSTEDKLATCTMYIAQCLADAINALAKKSNVVELFVSGGGAYNEYLLALLQAEIGTVQLVIPKDEIIQHKESMLMALCGYLHLREIPNSFATATGARMDTINGIIHHPEL